MSAVKRVQTTATVAGLIAFVLLLLVPFLPVKQTESSVSWPQNGSVASVNAPLISLAPQQLDVTVPLSAIDELREDQSLLLGTLPEGSPKASDRGFFVTSPDGGLVVSSLNEVLLQLTPAQVKKLPDDAKLEAHLAHDLTTVEIPGTDYAEEDDEEDYRPQLTGIYTELKDEQKLIDAGLSAHVDINSRFTSKPTLIKTLAMVLGLISALISLAALRKMDRPAPAPTGAQASRRPGGRRPRLLARLRRQHLRRRLPAHHGARSRQHGLHGQLLPLVRRARGALRRPLL